MTDSTSKARAQSRKADGDGKRRTKTARDVVAPKKPTAKAKDGAEKKAKLAQTEEREQKPRSAARAKPAQEGEKMPKARKTKNTSAEESEQKPKARKTAAKPAVGSEKKPKTGKTEDKGAGAKREKTGKQAAKGRAKREAKTDARAQERGVSQERRKPRNPGDLFMERRPARSSGTKAQRKRRGQSGLTVALNLCLAAGIAAILFLGVRQQREYEAFLRMRDVVDQQTFYDGTQVEGVDVSRMTLANALDYWREKVEPRYADRAAVLDDGTTVTAGELGYTSDYESVLYAAWSAGRSGSLEERYAMASQRSAHPVAYAVTRSDYSGAALDRYVQTVALRVDREPVEADIASFNAETYEFQFTESKSGAKLDAEALKEDVKRAIASGGGNVTLAVETVEPQVTTEDVASRYGLIDYAITNASSSSRARLNNIALAMSTINGTRVEPGEVFSFNEAVGQRTTARGYRKATAYSGGDVTEQVGGGICQVSTTLFNAAVKADMEIVERHNHSLTVAYVDKGKDATVDWGNQDFRFKNTSADAVYICCYLTDDKRVRFGIFGRLLPDGEKITVDAVTTEVVKYETQYEPTPFLPTGQTNVSQKGRNGYKAEAYKVRWDAQGNQISRELLCKSTYQKKNEIVQVGM